MSDAAADAPPAKKSDGPPRRSAKDKTCYNCGEVRFCTSAYHIPTWYQIYRWQANNRLFSLESYTLVWTYCSGLHKPSS